jgi:hypothetical protein
MATSAVAWLGVYHLTTNLHSHPHVLLLLLCVPQIKTMQALAEAQGLMPGAIAKQYPLTSMEAERIAYIKQVGGSKIEGASHAVGHGLHRSNVCH